MFRKLVRLTNADYRIDPDHGWPMIVGDFAFEDGGGFGALGLYSDLAFVRGFLGAVGVHSIRELEGKSFWMNYSKEPRLVGSVTDDLVSISPLHKEDGTPFRIDMWRESQREKEV